MRDRIREVRSQLLALQVSARGGIRVSDMAFINEMQRFRVMFLLSEIVDTHIFSDAVKPRGKGCLAPEGVDSTECFEPCLLCEVFSGFRVLDVSENVVVDMAVVFDKQRVKRFGVAELRAFYEMCVVKIKQSLGFLSFEEGCGVEF